MSACVTTTGATGYVPCVCSATASDGGNVGTGRNSGIGARHLSGNGVYQALEKAFLASVYSR